MCHRSNRCRRISRTTYFQRDILHIIDTYVCCSKVVSSLPGRLLNRPGSSEAMLLWKNNDVPPWQRSDCLSERADVLPSRVTDLAGKKPFSRSTERLCEDVYTTQSQDSVLVPHPPREQKRQGCFRRRPSLEDIATQTQRLHRPKVDRSLGENSRPDT